jgi:hypothetical protein
VTAGASRRRRARALAAGARRCVGGAPGIFGALATVDHKRVGGASSSPRSASSLCAGILAALMRLQLAFPSRRSCPRTSTTRSSRRTAPR